MSSRILLIEDEPGLVLTLSDLFGNEGYNIDTSSDGPGGLAKALEGGYDLQGLARRRLAALGVVDVQGNDGSLGWSTVANPSRFFSHRRDRVSGRFAAAVWRA